MSLPHGRQHRAVTSLVMTPEHSRDVSVQQKRSSKALLLLDHQKQCQSCRHDVLGQVLNDSRQGVLRQHVLRNASFLCRRRFAVRCGRWHSDIGGRHFGSSCLVALL